MTPRNERRPSGYQPPGFNPSNDMNISFPNTEGWSMESSTCGRVKTNFQAVNLGVAYTKGISLDDDSEAVVMPEFTYGEEFSRLEPFYNQNDVHREEYMSGNAAQESPTPHPSSVVGDDASLSLQAQVRQTTTSAQGDMASHRDVGVGVDTQDKEDLSRLKLLVSGCISHSCTLLTVL